MRGPRVQRRLLLPVVARPIVHLGDARLDVIQQLAHHEAGYSQLRRQERCYGSPDVMRPEVLHAAALPDRGDRTLHILAVAGAALAGEYPRRAPHAPRPELLQHPHRWRAQRDSMGELVLRPLRGHRPPARGEVEVRPGHSAELATTLRGQKVELEERRGLRALVSERRPYPANLVRGQHPVAGAVLGGPFDASTG